MRGKFFSSIEREEEDYKCFLIVNMWINEMERMMAQSKLIAIFGQGASIQIDFVDASHL